MPLRSIPGRENGQETVNSIWVEADKEYLEMFGFSPADIRNGKIMQDNSLFVTKEAVRQFGWDDPIGKRLKKGYDEDETYTVQGVLKDMNFTSLHEAKMPGVIVVRDPFISREYYSIAVKISPGNMEESLQYIEKTWKRFCPDQIFSIQFLDSMIDNMYKNEKRTGRVLMISSVMTILISCLGLFGLSAIAVSNRRKEIGIRKSIGATAHDIVLLLSRDFVKLIIIANVIAFPAAFFLVKEWLDNFAYRIAYAQLIYLFAAFVTLAVAITTISFQTIRAALANPVDSLKCE